MSTKLSLALVAFVLVHSILGLEPLELSEPPLKPKYLVPVEPFGREYEESILNILGERKGGGTMIYYESPHTGNDFVVSVWRKNSANDEDKRTRHSFITWVEVSPTNRHTRAVVKKQMDIPIDVDFAIAVQRAWATMLLKTRYPTHRYLGLHGWQTEFSVSVQGAGDVFGQLGGASEGLPKEFMDLGFALADYCKSSQAERPNKRAKLINWLGDFEKRAAES